MWGVVEEEVGNNGMGDMRGQVEEVVGSSGKAGMGTRGGINPQGSIRRRRLWGKGMRVIFGQRGGVEVLALRVRVAWLEL